MKNILLAITLCIACPALLLAQTASNASIAAKLETNIPALMQRDYIPGLTAAYIQDGKLVWQRNYGVANAKTKTPVTDSTLFEAASLTKVVTAYAALKLVDAHQLDLDKPLNAYLGNNYEVGSDQRITMITARRVLSHSAGFPNWRNEGDSLLPINFAPGERFSYSGEGFVYLAKVLEKLTGKSYEMLIEQTVFKPLGMSRSSITWKPSFQNVAAYRHTWTGDVSALADYPDANAAASLRTTAKDYATFLAAVLNGTGLTKASHEAMLTAQIKVDPTKYTQLYWGLGIGLERTENARYCWHWGDQGDSKALFVANINAKDAIIYFTNSANGLSIAPDIISIVYGDKNHDILKYIAYGKFDTSALVLVKSIKQDGADAALKNYQQTRKTIIDENAMNSIGYSFLNANDIPNAIAVFTQNTKDFPNSWNVWDSLAEAYMKQGNKKLAIEYYEKSLVLNPKNDNGAQQLKKLKAQ
ncbi:serine hydrolase [Chitinophagaceae bacterium 26-R-25]|nr:serine hydrolase [Chitinophagaceae bacterium 26-R-25]